MCNNCSRDDLSPARNFLIGLAVAAGWFACIALAAAWLVST